MPAVAQIQRFPEPDSRFADEGRASKREVQYWFTLGPVVPSQSSLGTLRDHRFRVETPLRVRTSKQEGRIVVEAVEINEFGFGNNFSEALADLQRAIVDLYLTLREDEARLGPDLQKVWTTLQEKIRAKL
ncbi:MAG: hypothetical protein O7J95_12815 [Planctomycetota bacterium]|nr:hypothetical protein [Planctomycetota bacterium]